DPVLGQRRVDATEAGERYLALGQVPDPRIVFGDAGEHEAVDGSRPDQIGDPVEWPAGGDEYLMTALAGRGDEELEELQHDSVVRAQLGVRYRVGDPVGTAGAQADRGRVRLVAELLDHGQYPDPGAVGEPAATAYDVGDGLP